MGTKFRREEPRIMGRGDRLYSLAEQIASWAESDELRRGTWVAGVWGGRGTGKTSLLATVLRLLAERAKAGGPKVALPGSKERSTSRHGHGPYDPELLFAPSFGRDGDDLLFSLLTHLKEHYPRLDGAEKEAEKVFASIRKAEVRRRDVQRFLDYEKETAVSPEEVAQRSIDLYCEIADTTNNVRESFRDLLKTFSPGGGRPLLLCVDDLDLRPDRALELLELIHHFLWDAGVLVLIAADRDLMLHGLEEALKKRRDLHQPGLAGALLAKLVPYGWALPVPSAPERLEELWPTTSAKGGQDGGHQTEEQDGNESGLPVWWVLGKKAQDVIRSTAEKALADVLPRTYRGLVAAQNRLTSLRDELAPKANHVDALSDAIRVRFGDFELSTDGAQFLSGVAMADLQSPKLRLMERFQSSPREFVNWLQLSRSSTDNMTSSDDLDVRLRRGLLTLYDALANEGRGAERFLTISMVADARIQAEPEWREHFTEEVINTWHLDLRDLAQGSTIDVKALREARSQAFAFLEERGIRGFQGRVELFAGAKLSFMAWLGWEMRFVPRVVGLNYLSGSFRRFEQQDPVRFLDDNRFRWLHPEPPLRPAAEPRDSAGHAVLIVDALGRSTESQLGQFVDESGTSMQAVDAYRLVAPPGEILQPADLKPLLQDVIETIGRLRIDRGITRLHLGMALPDVVAFFLGRQLNAQGMEIFLYEFNGTKYERVFRLDRNEP